ncbi:MAG: 4Fe-4S dicluster domain-containing protein [Desulfobacterales bacterium]|nr:4Fe-4S dicluster domain-containing protein [Desulfobacterales bacterium]
MGEENQKVTVFWYSQTGNSFACVERACNVLSKNNYNVTACSILSPTDESYRSDLFLFVFPVYAFYVPVPVRDFIDNMPIQPVNKKALAIITCSGAPANTSFVAGRLLSEKNIDLVNHLVIRSRTSYIPLAKWFAWVNQKTKPDEKSLARVESFIGKNMVGGVRERTLFFNPLSLFHWIGVSGKRNGPKGALGKRTFIKEDCTNCNFCVVMCPSGAITNVEEIKYNDELCIGCCGCINICPTNAWRISSAGPEYYNKGINVKKMVAATGRLKE